MAQEELDVDPRRDNNALSSRPFLNLSSKALTMANLPLGLLSLP